MAFSKFILAVTVAFSANASVHAATSVASAVLKDGSVLWTVISNESEGAKAKAIALDQCKKMAKGKAISKPCSETLAYPGPGYVAVVTSLPGTTGRVSAAYGAIRKNTINEAYLHCSQNGRFECSNEAEYIGWESGPFREADPQAVQEQAKKRYENFTPAVREQWEANRAATSSRGKSSAADR